MTKNSLLRLACVGLMLATVYIAPSRATEQKAFAFFNHLLTCPVAEVPKWSAFVDTMAQHLDGNARYAPLRASLIEAREVSGFMGKAKIAVIIKTHKALIPQEIAEKTKALGLLKLQERIKF